MKLPDNQRKAMFARVQNPYEKSLREFGYDIDLSPDEDIVEIRVPDKAIADSLMTRIEKAGWEVPLVTESPLTVYGKKKDGDIESLTKELI